VPAQSPRPTKNNVNHQGSREAPRLVDQNSEHDQAFRRKFGVSENNEIGAPDQRNLHSPEGGENNKNGHGESAALGSVYGNSSGSDRMTRSGRIEQPGGSPAS
jgi:hypothetical protein